MLNASMAAAFNWQPVILGALADQLNFDSQQVGLIVAVELAGVALAGVLATLWVRLWRWRWVAGLSTGIMIAGNLGTAWLIQQSIMNNAASETFSTLVFLRLLLGVFGTGTAYATSIAVISGTQRLSRNFSWVIIAQVLVSISGLALLPGLIQSWGLAAVYLSLAAVGAVALVGIRYLPRGSAHHETRAEDSGPDTSRRSFVALGSLATWYVGIGAFWAFAERLGDSLGIPATAIGQALALSTVIGLLGALSSALLGDRLGRIVPYAIGSAGQLLAMLLIVGMAHWTHFLVAVSVHQIFWNLTIPYVLSLISDMARGGRAVVLIPTAQTTGLSLGPVLGGSLIVSFGLGAIPALVAATMLLSMVIYLTLARRFSTT